MGNLEGIFRGFFLTHRTKAQNFGENFGAFFVRKFVARKKSFVQNSLCRRATLRHWEGEEARFTRGTQADISLGGRPTSREYIDSAKSKVGGFCRIG